MKELRFSVLGPLHASCEGVGVALGSTHERTILALLLLREGEQVSVEQMIDVVWGGAAPSNARHAVQTYIYRLRRSLSAVGAHRVVSSVGGGYGLPLDRHQFDLREFKVKVREAERFSSAGQPATAMTCIDQALDLWTGVPLAGTGTGLQGWRTALGEMRLGALEQRLSLALDLGQHIERTAELAVLVEEHPLHERFCELFVIALYRSNRQAEALEVYRRTCRRLREELGLAPGARLQELHQRILTADPALHDGQSQGVGTRAGVGAGAGPGARAPEAGHGEGSGELTLFYEAFGELRQAVAHISEQVARLTCLVTATVGGADFRSEPVAPGSGEVVPRAAAAESSSSGLSRVG
ncbi:BTAD domain-containing putative transcriptional regulator [Streptomyces sp. NPDC048297]|uniref:AfsR/SARP family transcriptional regulator n=1 Tax=Streptomyces sp. NPDC048297 TaxID=3365531 RepID=UPI003721E5E1